MLSSLLSRLPRIPSATPVSRPRRIFQLLVAAALLPATALGPAALQADSRSRAENPVRTPLHTESTRSGLLGTPSAGAVATQNR